MRAIVLAFVLVAGCASHYASLYESAGRVAGSAAGALIPEQVQQIAEPLIEGAVDALDSDLEAKLERLRAEGKPMDLWTIIQLILAGGLTGIGGYNIQRKARMKTEARVASQLRSPKSR